MERAISGMRVAIACAVLFAGSASGASTHLPEQWQVENPPGFNWREIEIDTTQPHVVPRCHR